MSAKCHSRQAEAFQGGEFNLEFALGYRRAMPLFRKLKSTIVPAAGKRWLELP
jgi:hypothetical protein